MKEVRNVLNVPPGTVSAERAKTLPVWWPLRAWLGVEVLFGLGASAAIFLQPGGSLANFAWPIKPDVMAATLGAIYLASLFALVPSLFVRVWQNVRVIVLPGAIFTAVLLLATFLHWDKFSTTTVPFYVWLASYVLPPPIFAAMYWWHQGRSRPAGSDIEHAMNGSIRTFFFVNGLGFDRLCRCRVRGAVDPAADRAVDVHPAHDPRVLRVSHAGRPVPDRHGLGERFPVRARIAAPMLVAFPFALAIQLFRFSAEVQWTNLALWVFIVDIVASALLCLAVWLQARGAARSAAT